MRRQILKGFTMVALIVGVAFMAAVVSANGQTSIGVTANIPFEFVVGDQTLPAGKYTVKTITMGSQVLAIRSQNKTALRQSNSLRASKAQDKGKLVFHRYGQRYFLSEVWSAGDEAGRQLRKSREERNIEIQLAAIPSKNDSVGSTYEVVEIVAMVR